MLWDELRRQLRGGRVFLIALGYTFALGCIFLGVSLLKPMGEGLKAWPEYGRALFNYFLAGQMLLTFAICPGLTAGTIALERKRGTLDFLLLTPLHSWSIILGKFLGSISQLVLVLLCGLPVICMVFVYGGVSPFEIFMGYEALLSLGALGAAHGLLASCRHRDTRLAIIQAYGYTAIWVAVVAFFTASCFAFVIVGLLVILAEIWHLLARSVDVLDKLRRPVDEGLATLLLADPPCSPPPLPPMKKM